MSNIEIITISAIGIVFVMATIYFVTNRVSTEEGSMSIQVSSNINDSFSSNQNALQLTPRPGEPPKVTSGIPHIQQDQTSSAELIEELSKQAFSLDGIEEVPSRASLPGTKALSVKPNLSINNDAVIVGREFAHIHPIPNGGGSLHLILSTESAEKVISKGWGEFHPFALDGTVPNMLMVYSPRNEKDLEVVMSIIKDATAFAIQN